MTTQPAPRAEAGAIEVFTIEGLGYGGEGYACPEPGRFVSIPHTLPGDVVEVELGEFRRGRAFGEVRRWVSRVASHSDPGCAAYAWCSGCALRHVSEAQERAFKLGEARSILTRYGPEVGEAVPLGWIGLDGRDGHRHRGRFAVSVSDGRVRLGLSSIGLDRAVVDLRRCPAQAPVFLETLGAVAARLDARPDLAAAARAVEIRTTREGAVAVVVDVEGDAAPLAALLDRAVLPPAALEVRTVESGSASGPDLPMRLRRRAAPEVSIDVPWESWVHATPAIAEALVDHVCASLGPVTGVLDLCSGVGTLSVRLAEQAAHVLSVDADHHGLRALAAAAAAAGMTHLDVRAGRLATILRRLRAEGAGPFEAATINPMRRPLGFESFADLPHLGVERIIYLGPAPVSAARDAAALARLGYGLDQAWVVNLHPSTAQFMLVLHLSRRQTSGDGSTPHA